MEVPSTTCTRTHIPEVPCECGANARTAGTSDTASSSLTDDDRRVIAGAREVLAAEHDYDIWSLTRRIGALEWHLAATADLAERLVGPPVTSERD